MPLPLSNVVVSVRDPRRVSDDVAYSIELTDIDRPIAEPLCSIRRTYKDCKMLIKSMQKKQTDLPAVPRTAVIGALDPQFVELRRAALEAFFNACLGVEGAEENVELQDVIGFTEYSINAADAPEGADVTKDVSTSLLHFVSDVREDAIASEFFTAARYALRTTSYTVGQLLPRLGPFSSPRKSHAVVKDENGNAALMSICAVGCQTPTGIEKPQTLKCFQRLLRSLDSRYFAPASDVIVANGKLLVVRPLFQQGSLLDQMHGTWGSAVLMNAADKYGRRVNAIPLDRLARIGFQLLQIIAGCHQYDLPVPTLLSLGNVLVVDETRIVIGDCFEDVIAGITRVPCVAPSSRCDERTPVDLLLFGCLMLQMALGVVLDEVSLASLLCCQGDPIDHRPVEERDEVRQIAIRDLPGFGELPEVVLNLLFYVFHPANAADVTVLLNHCFFAGVKAEALDGVSEEDASPLDENAIPLFHFKAKDIALVQEATQRWEAHLNEREAKRLRRAEERKALREAKRTVSVQPLPTPRPASPRKVRSAATLKLQGLSRGSVTAAPPAPTTSAACAPAAPSVPTSVAPQPAATAIPVPPALAPTVPPPAPPVAKSAPPPPPTKGPPPPPGAQKAVAAPSAPPPPPPPMPK